MGDVAYHLPNFDDFIVQTKISSAAKKVLGGSFYMTCFNIGDLDHAPSREAISYDEKTWGKVKRRVNRDIFNYYRTEFKELMSGDWNIYKFYKKFKDTAMWGSLESFQLPFTGNHTLKSINPDNRRNGRFDGDKIYPLMGKVETIKGWVWNVTGVFKTFSGSVDTISHDRLCKINNPTFLFRSKV